MSLVDVVGTRAGKYVVNVRGAQGVQVGDHNRQDNVFNALLDGLRAAEPGFPDEH